MPLALPTEMLYDTAGLIPTSFLSSSNSQINIGHYISIKEFSESGALWAQIKGPAEELAGKEIGSERKAELLEHVQRIEKITKNIVVSDKHPPMKTTLETKINTQIAASIGIIDENMANVNLARLTDLKVAIVALKNFISDQKDGCTGFLTVYYRSFPNEAPTPPDVAILNGEISDLNLRILRIENEKLDIEQAKLDQEAEKNQQIEALKQEITGLKRSNLERENQLIGALTREITGLKRSNLESEAEKNRQIGVLTRRNEALNREIISVKRSDLESKRELLKYK